MQRKEKQEFHCFRKFPVFSGGGNCNMIACNGLRAKFPVGRKIVAWKKGLQYVKELISISQFDY